MTRLRGKELSRLYPTPKSLETLQAERNHRLLARRPKFVAIKISVSSAIMFSVILLSYRLAFGLMSRSLSSYGEVIAGLSLSVLMTTVALAIIFYFYLVIQELASKVFGSSTEVFTLLIFVWFFGAVSLALLSKFQVDSLLTTTVVVAVCIGVSYAAIDYRRRRTKLS